MKKGVLLIGGLILLSWLVYECKYYTSYWFDTFDRPWAYSSDKNAKLLVGKWQGSFIDPDNVKKTLEIEIDEPVTEEERERNAARKRSSRRRDNKRSFDGKAIAKSRLGTETYEIYGAVEKDDFHRLHFNFRPEDEKKRVLPNFTLLEANSGNWQDSMTLTLSFTYHNADGSSTWKSSDPRHSKKVTATLGRIPQ
ncbi:hypothetical protein [Runella sp. SP2]|uniref:hypothetical protein n=1 Tax=Runella sp. SP2 TaxID=2268026 RepID=UPI000F07E32C|nr:hypothetical protein [Runella sp. SP2]AYQ34872.1 hypothetical protein DTQ70_23055 [Runella sp. SP2]